MKITFDKLQALFAKELTDNFCIEILFSVSNDETFYECYMGKSSQFKKPYWFGLSSDGKAGYDFDDFDQMSKAPVFNKRCLYEISDKIEILEIDGCEPEERINFYLKSEAL